MKKSIVKALSAFLALVLILSVLPMAAFAAETDQHEHMDQCCQNEVQVYATCKHVYTLTLGTRYEEINQYYHRSYDAEIRTCTLCGYTTYVQKGPDQISAHYVPNWVLVNQDASGSYYRGQCSYCWCELFMTISD